MSKLLKRYAIGAFGAVSVLSAAAAFCLKTPANVNAETTPCNMSMVAGASARLESDGLRFIVQMDTVTKTEIVNNDTVTLELWIMPGTAWTAQKDTENYAAWTKAEVKVDESKIYQLEDATGEENPWYANGVLTGINDMGYNKMDMVCVPVKVDSAGDTPVYTLEKESVAATEMSLYGVLNCAVLDTAGMSAEAVAKVFETYSWFGSADYPVDLKDQAAYDALIENVNRGVDFAGKTAVNSGKTTPTLTVDEDKTGAMPVVNTYYAVRFCEADGTLIKEVLVKEGGSVSSDTLNGITPKDISGKMFDGWSAVTDVTEDMTITATYTNVWAVTFYDADNTTVLKTAYVKDGEALTSEDLKINVTVNDSDSRFKGWALSAEGEIVPDLTNVTVTENVSYYPVLEQKAAVKVTVLVEDYSAAVFSAGDGGEKSERFAYLDNGNEWNDVIGAYLGDKQYTDKTEEFSKLIEKAALKGFAGDAVSLAPFKASLPDVYSWVAENVDVVTVVEGEEPSVTIKLDANEKTLGFSLKDVYTVYSYADPVNNLKGLTLLEDGTAGVWMTNAGLNAVYRNVCLRPNAVNVAEYKSIRLNFTYKAADYLRLYLNQGEWNTGTYFESATDWTAASVELKSVAAKDGNPVETLRAVRFTTQDNVNNSYEILFTGLTYLKISSTENTTLSAEEVNILAQPMSGNGSVALTTDENGVQVVRFTSEADADCSWPGRGFAIDLSGITDATYASVIVKFKVRNAEAFGSGNIRVGVDGGNAEAFVPVATTEQIDLMNLGIDGDAYVNIKANGLGSVWICLPEILCITNDVVIDIYSIEFVVNTSAAE